MKLILWRLINSKFENDDKKLPAVVGVPKSLLKRFENSMKDIQTFWSPTTKAPDEEQLDLT